MRRDDETRLELSQRERQILKLASEGNTDTAIAHKLGISEATVGTYWGRVRIKLGPYGRTELVAKMVRAEQEAEVEALRSENQKLISELQDAVSGAPTPETLYHDLLENAPDAVLVVGEGGIIQYGNAAASDTFGYSAQELQGMHILTLVPERYRLPHLDHQADYFKNPQRRPMGGHADTSAVRKDGTEFPMRAALSATQTPKGLLVTCIVRPIPQED
jgi:PAS domain S-box-containing protein